MKTLRVWRVGLRRWRSSVLADQRGAVAFEMLFVFIFLVFSLLLPLADVAIAGFQFISAWEALRGFGQSIQYSPPPDLTDSTAISTWKSDAIAKADPKYPISNFQLTCGGVACSSSNTASPKNYSYSTSVTLAPMVLTSVLCSNSCTFTLSHSERFQ